MLRVPIVINDGVYTPPRPILIVEASDRRWLVV